ncbi:MAG: hypothetical protein EB116_05515, partial [Betaproteobacteria bacterium]|nr:hypothetical protein [Betaproteobacteria bacterium]
VFVHAQNADVAAVVVAAGVDAAADVQVDVAQVEQLVQVLVARGDGCGDGRIGRRDCWVRRAARSLSTAGHRRPCLDGGKPGGQCASISAMHLPHHKP